MTPSSLEQQILSEFREQFVDESGVNDRDASDLEEFLSQSLLRQRQEIGRMLEEAVDARGFQESDAKNEKQWIRSSLQSLLDNPSKQ